MGQARRAPRHPEQQALAASIAGARAPPDDHLHTPIRPDPQTTTTTGGPNTTKRLRLTGLLASAAALLAGAAPISASAAERPLNYGNCVSYEAMFGDSVREFTDFFGPATAVADMVNLAPGSDRLYVACAIPEG